MDKIKSSENIFPFNLFPSLLEKTRRGKKFLKLQQGKNNESCAEYTSLIPD